MGASASGADDDNDKPCRIVIVGSPNDPALLELEHLPADAIVVAAGETIEELQASGDPSFADANVLLNVSGSRATLAPILRHLPHLVWVHSLTAGVDHILCPALVDDETITLTNAKGLYSSSLAEYVLAAASYFAKDFPRLARNKASKTWDRYCVQELRGATMGIVGYGSIGQACARLAKAYGMKVVGLRRRPMESQDDPFVDDVLGFDGLHTLMAESDYLVVAAALTPQTKHLLSSREFAYAKPGQVVINIGRGLLLNETDLVNALASGVLKGAALDVFAQEPLPAPSPLWDLPNVLISPHNADMTADFRHQSVRLFCDNCYKFLAGDNLINVVDKSSGY